METSTMIRQLRRTAKKHENDKLYTFDTNISMMCTDVANRLEELEKENKEIRNKAIDEFAERVKQGDVIEYMGSYVSYEAIASFIDEIAECLKGGATDERT